jgi:hypothetical protein
MLAPISETRNLARVSSQALYQSIRYLSLTVSRNISRNDNDEASTELAPKALARSITTSASRLT